MVEWSSQWIWLSAVLRLLLCASVVVASPFSEQIPLEAAHHSKGPLNSTSPWNGWDPSQTLQFHACFGEYECARLLVPMNHKHAGSDWRHADGESVALAVIKLPASVSVTDPRYGGAIILNPGGPGESGVHQVLTGGPHVQKLVSVPHQATDNSTRYFDIVSFDPRGVNNTTPRLLCFPDPVAQWNWAIGSTDYGLLWSSTEILGNEIVRGKALGESCELNTLSTPIIKHLNTAQTAADVVSLVEKLGQWREHQASRELAADGSLTDDERRRGLNNAAWRVGKEPIQYWGFSYGTLLGQTLASLYPDRVSRLVLDGVMDARDYYRQSWSTNLRDSDKIITQFSEYCFQAGPKKCPLYTGSSGSHVEAKVERILTSLKSNPLIIPGQGWDGPMLLTYGDMHLRLLSAMYFPRHRAERFFDQLAAVEARNYTRLRLMKKAIISGPERTSRCKRDGPFSEACVSDYFVSGLGANQAISCMDSARLRQRNLTIDGFSRYLEYLRRQSKWISPNWGRNRLQCLGFTSEPAWAFDGPIRGRTAHPMLVIGNSFDTVCPWANAKEIESLFPGSVMLHHDSEGHCSYSNPSVCTGRAVRDYFQTGQLPAPNTICEPESRPFVGCVRKDKSGDCAVYEGEDAHIFRAVQDLARSWSV